MLRRINRTKKGHDVLSNLEEQINMQDLIDLFQILRGLSSGCSVQEIFILDENRKSAGAAV